MISLTHVGGPTVLIEVDGWRLLTDPTFDAPGRRYDFGWGTSSRKTTGPAVAVAVADLPPIDAVLLSHDHHGDNLDTAGRALLPSAPVVITTASKRIVGYSIDARMTSDLAVTALRNAVALRGPAATVVHSDRGSQFRSHAYQRELRSAGLRGSMGRVGTCADNAAMESFFSLLQKNVLNRRRWRTRAELRLAIVTWIETTYQRRRRQDGLGRLTPVEFETLLNAAHAA
ncbi:DDE-type integrase/transposase/recombinase [Pseudonocardia humida]|uniref:DDE-type integrase/transposase/recombinase n=1 Tax=Pseudonocardia humida TaxID=2800819 RepID=A0ABT1ADH7_9PSEU|nr:DDE-type integrase/transposase/recombinase [Pseudonocardia humida]MCO1660978.1 DDE-type integrase/transposase/recombinase [Pseudonocardia humida]